MREMFEVVITAIVAKDDKYLILQRSLEKKRFPGRWTVPGGHLESRDFIDTPKETKDYWYNVLEKTLHREVREESGLEINDIEYVTSPATVHDDGALSLVISCLAKFESGEIKLPPEETAQSAWVTLAEAKTYDLIDGIYDELVMADELRTGHKHEWSRSKS